MPARLIAVCLALLLAFCATASAAVVGGQAADPSGDSTAGPGTDAVSASWSFDSDARRWTVSVTFAAVPTSGDYGVVNATLRDATAAGCGGSAFAELRGSNNSGGASASVGTSADGVQPDGSTGASTVPGTNVKSDEGRTTTLEVTHPRLVGRSAGCVTIGISNHGVKDSVSVPAPGVTVTPNPTVTPGPYTQPPPPAPGAVRVRLSSSRRLRFVKGAARLTLAPSTAPISGRLTLAIGKRTIAKGRFSARTPVTIKTKLFLTRQGAVYFRRHRSGKAVLTIRSTAGARSTTQRFRVTARR